jgi:hypothetical protein
MASLLALALSSAHQAAAAAPIDRAAVVQRHQVHFSRLPALHALKLGLAHPGPDAPALQREAAAVPSQRRAELRLRERQHQLRRHEARQGQPHGPLPVQLRAVQRPRAVQVDDELSSAGEPRPAELRAGSASAYTGACAATPAELHGHRQVVLGRALVPRPDHFRAREHVRLTSTVSLATHLLISI